MLFFVLNDGKFISFICYVGLWTATRTKQTHLKTTTLGNCCMHLIDQK